MELLKENIMAKTPKTEPTIEPKDTVTVTVTEQAIEEAAQPIPASTLAEMEAGRKALEKIAQSA